MKRFTDTEKWRDPWFRKLSSPAKQLWQYVCDNCNPIGLIELDFALVSIDCGQTIEPQHATELGDRIQPLNGNKYFLPKFIHFQYGELSPNCPPHQTIIKQVKAHSLVKDGLLYHHPHPSARVELPLRQDKTRQEWNGQDKKEGGVGETKSVLEQKQKFKVDTRYAWLAGELCKLYGRSSDGIANYEEQQLCAEVGMRPEVTAELSMLKAYRGRLLDRTKFPQSVLSLLQKWQQTLDRAKNHAEPMNPGEFAAKQRNIREIRRISA